MEIFTNEFKELLSTQLEELTNVVKKDEAKKYGAVVMSDCEIAKLMDACMNNSDCSKKEKKKKKNQFEEGDVVYFAGLEGIVTKQYNDDSNTSTFVRFNKYDTLGFTKDGRILFGTPIVLSHFPYKLKMKKIK
jgi:hypothetical protein